MGNKKRRRTGRARESETGGRQEREMKSWLFLTQINQHAYMTGDSIDKTARAQQEQKQIPHVEYKGVCWAG
jgi:hypothetical protein